MLGGGLREEKRREGSNFSKVGLLASLGVGGERWQRVDYVYGASPSPLEIRERHSC